MIREFWTVLQHDNFQTAILMIAVFIACWKLMNNQKTVNPLPPGPRGLPIVGNLLSLNLHSEQVMSNWNKIYGPVCHLKFAAMDFILLGNLEAVTEAFVKKGDIFSDRLQNSLVYFSGDSGIVFVNSGSHHKEQRRFGLTTLKLFGMGKRSLEPKILALASDLCDEMDRYCVSGEPVDVTLMIYEAVSAVISLLVFNKNLPKENDEFRKWLLRTMTGTKYSSINTITMFYPSLRAIPPFRWGVQEAAANQKINFRIIQNQIEEHKVTRDQNEPRDYIDCFLQEMEDRRKKSGTTPNQDEQGFDEKQLIAVVRDLFLGGSDTSSTTLCWAMLYLCKYPLCQSALHKEIDEKLHQRLPTMNDASKMNYVKAVIHETLRMRPIVPVGIPHMASRDGTVMGYHIKKGSCLAPNIYHIMHDETLWSDPEKFDPTRHLDESGKFVKNPNHIAFSVGPRQCLGMQLAEMELFLFLVSIFQKFSFKLYKGDEIDMRGKNVIALRPYPFKVIISRR